MKSNIKKFCKINNVNKKIKHDPSFVIKQISKFKKELKKIGVKLFIVTNLTNNLFNLEEWYEKNIDKLVGNFIYFLEKDIYNAAFLNGLFNIYHSINDNILIEFNKIIVSCFPHRTLGIMNVSDSIKVYLEEKKTIKIDKPKQSIELDIIFLDKTLKMDSKKAFDNLTSLIKKYGYIDEYDLLISNGSWNVLLNIEIDNIDKFKKIINNIKILGKQKIKNIIIN